MNNGISLTLVRKEHFSSAIKKRLLSDTPDEFRMKRFVKFKHND